MIKQAIIPLAGLGTRMLPLTSVLPKELLPINGKPNLDYILEECLEAGIKEFIFIISKKKLSIKKYFFNDNFYKKIIKKVRHGRVRVLFHKPIKFKKYGNRKNLSYACYKAVVNGLESPEKSF